MLTKEFKNQNSLKNMQNEHFDLFWFILDDSFPLLVVEMNSLTINYANKKFYKELEIESMEPAQNLEKLLCTSLLNENIAELLKSVRLGKNQKKNLHFASKTSTPKILTGNFFRWIDKENLPQVMILFTPGEKTPYHAPSQKVTFTEIIRSEIEKTYHLLRKIQESEQNLIFAHNTSLADMSPNLQQHLHSALSKLSMVRSFIDLQDFTNWGTPVPVHVSSLLQEVKDSFLTIWPDYRGCFSLDASHDLPESVILAPRTISCTLIILLEGLMNFCKTTHIQVNASRGITRGNLFAVSLLVHAQFDSETETGRVIDSSADHCSMHELLGTVKELILHQEGKVLLKQLDENSFYFHFTINALLPNTSNQEKGSAMLTTASCQEMEPEQTVSEPCSKTFPENTQVLVTGDVDQNQLEMKEQLSKFGITATFEQSCNGVEELLKSRPFDLIVMDFQMPGLNELNALEIIRSANNTSIAEIPIIILGSSASGNAKKLCINAGADAFFNKPYQLNDLRPIMIALVETYRARMTLYDEKSYNHNTEMEKYFDLTSLNEISEGDKEFTFTMISYFVEHTPLALENLISRINAQDWPEVRQIAHKLKPQLIYMGIHSIQEDVELIEQYSNQKIHLDLIPAMAAKTEKHCLLAIEQLKEELKNLEM